MQVSLNSFKNSKLLSSMYNNAVVIFLPISALSCHFRTTQEDPIPVRDSLSGSIIRFGLHVNAAPSDNPMQSEISGHIGGGGNCKCCRCLVGGTRKSKESNDGFHALFRVGVTMRII
jgi:hypothetical protein